MAAEIERKFLVHEHLLPPLQNGEAIRQGYFSTSKSAVVRVRTKGQSAFLTVKSATQGISREEFEYAIPVADANYMLDHLCPMPQILKTRYCINIGRHVWELDVFAGENTGLIVAEIELTSTDELFEKPLWAATEVSTDHRYYNSQLLQHPYCQWQ